MDLEKYIKIPYKLKGRSFEGCDCWGLVRLVLKEEFRKELPLFTSYETVEDVKKITKLIKENQPIVCTERKPLPDIGDIVLITFSGMLQHLGIYVGDARVLHTLKKTGAMCTRIDHPMLRGKIEGYYEVKNS